MAEGEVRRTVKRQGVIHTYEGEWEEEEPAATLT